MYGKAGARWWRSCERSRCEFKTLHDRRNTEASQGRRGRDENNRTSQSRVPGGVHKTTTEARTATDVVRAYFNALQQGQFDSLGALFADDVRWHQPGQGTLSACVHAQGAVFELFGEFMQLSGGTFAIDQVETIMANGDFVAATLHFHARRGAEQIAMNGVDVMRVRDGQIVEVWLFSADQRSEESAFWSRA